MQEEEIKKIRDKCLLFNEFMAKHIGPNNPLSAAYAESNFLIENAYRKRKIKPLLAMSADIDEQVMRHMPLELAAEIIELFKAKLNIKIDNKQIIESIIKRGRILNEDEFRIVENEISDMLQAVKAHHDPEILKKMLISFHSKTKN